MSKKEEYVNIKKIGKLTKVYIYSVGYYTYEESEYNYLTHEQQFTMKQFRELIEEVAVKVIKNRKKDDYMHSYQDIHNKVIDVLINEKGFSCLQTQVDWSVFGWSSLFKQGDWIDNASDNNKSLIDAIHKAGFTEADDTFLQEDRKWNK